MSSNTQASGVAHRMLRLIRGAGQPEEIPLDLAGAYRGTVEEVLRHLVAEGHVRDEGLIQMLDDPRTVFERFGITPNGAPVEEPVSPLQDWTQLVNKAKEELESELGLARAHAGG